MTRVIIEKKHSSLQRMCIAEHAMFDQYGKDVVCAGISAICIGGLNGLDEMFRDQCDLYCNNGRIEITVKKDSEKLQSALKMMYYQLKSIKEVYPDHIQMKEKEV